MDQDNLNLGADDSLAPNPHLEDVDLETQRHWEEEYYTWESVEEHELTLGEKLADKVAEFGGSWTFIGAFSGFVAGWIIFNTCVFKLDGYPFILLNLMLSLVAALQAPVIMMSQRRQEDRDRARAKLDFELSRKAELEIKELKRQNAQLIKLCETMARDMKGRR